MVKKGKLESFIVGQDMYGYAIGINYKGSGTFQTRLGAFCTFATYALILTNLITLIIAFNDGSK